MPNRRLASLARHLSAAPAAADASPTPVRVTVGPYTFLGHLEETAAPKTCALFRSLLPHSDKIIQARWSGFAAWIPSPLGEDMELPVVPPENATAVPLPGQLLFYPGGISEVEILFPYGPTTFASVGAYLPLLSPLFPDGLPLSLSRSVFPSPSPCLDRAMIGTLRSSTEHDRCCHERYLVFALGTL